MAPSVLSSLVTHPCQGSPATPVRKNPKMCVLSTPGQSRGTNGFCCQHISEVALGLEQPHKHLSVWPLLFRITRYDYAHCTDENSVSQRVEVTRTWLSSEKGFHLTSTLNSSHSHFPTPLPCLRCSRGQCPSLPLHRALNSG